MNIDNMTVGGLVTITGLGIGIAGILLALAMERWSDHPRKRHWSGIGVAVCISTLAWLFASYFLVSLGMSIIRACSMVGGVLLFMFGYFWPSIEKMVGYKSPPASASTAGAGHAEPAIHVLYQNHRLQIYNDGEANLRLWGTQLENSPASIGNEPRIIAPRGGMYFIYGDRLEHHLLSVLPDGQSHMGLELFLQNDIGDKYVGSLILVVHVANRSISSIDTQLIGLDKKAWPDGAAAAPHD